MSATRLNEIFDEIKQFQAVIAEDIKNENWDFIKGHFDKIGDLAQEGMSLCEELEQEAEDEENNAADEGKEA